MSFAAKGHDVWTMDSYLRRHIAMETGSEALTLNPNLMTRARIFEGISGKRITTLVGDCADYRTMARLFTQFKPEAVIHYAEQPSAPYSMISFDTAHRTLNNNLNATFNTIFTVLENAPECHIIKLGTMGEYGTPNIDIEEGWLEVEHKGRREKFLYPRQAGSLYHTTKVLDTDLLWFYVRTYGVRVTDLMQGPVYGLSTPEADLDARLIPNFHYDDIFGTVVNRFLTQAVAGIPLTVYGKGGQTRGYLNILDTIKCVELAMNNPPPRGEFRILNQFTQLFTVNELAEKIKRVGDHKGLAVSIQPIKNPRKEREEHYYNAQNSGLKDLGLKPHLMTDDVISGMLDRIAPYKDRIDPAKVMPRVRWA